MAESTSGDSPTLSLTDALLADPAALRATLLERLADRRGHAQAVEMTLDASALNNIGLAAVQVLLAAKRSCPRLRLVDAPERIKRTLQAAGLTPYLLSMEPLP